MNLTPREKQIVNLLIKGFSNKDISKLLAIGPNSVHSRVYEIRKKMNVETTRQLIVRYTQGV